MCYKKFIDVPTGITMIYRFDGRVFLASNSLAEIMNLLRYIPMYLAVIGFGIGFFNNLLLFENISYYLNKSFYISAYTSLYLIFAILLVCGMHYLYFTNKNELAIFFKENDTLYHITLEDVLKNTYTSVLNLFGFNLVKLQSHTAEEVMLKTINLSEVVEITYNYNQINIFKANAMMPLTYMFEINPNNQLKLVRWFNRHYPSINIYYMV